MTRYDTWIIWYDGFIVQICTSEHDPTFSVPKAKPTQWRTNGHQCSAQYNWACTVTHKRSQIISVFALEKKTKIASQKNWRCMHVLAWTWSLMDTTTMVSVVPGLFGFSTPLFPCVRGWGERCKQRTEMFRQRTKLTDTNRLTKKKQILGCRRRITDKNTVTN
jgi:hypothetical protein